MIKILKKWLFSQYFIALVVILILTFWMLPALNKDHPKVAKDKENFTIPPFQVLIEEVKLERINPKITLSGLVKSENNLIVRSQVVGKVVKNHITKGEKVVANTLLIELDEQESKTSLDEAKANYQTKKINFESEKSLFDKQLSSKVKLSGAETSLKNAKAILDRAELNFNNRSIKSDFSGEVNTIFVEVGDFVSVGSALVEVLDLNNLKVEAELLPSELVDLKRANLDLSQFKVEIDHPIDSAKKSIPATLKFVSKKANPKSRSYPIEINIDENKDIFSLEQWVQFHIQLPSILAYPVSRSLLSIDDEGHFLVDVVNNLNEVETVNVEIIRDDNDKVWVTGLSSGQKVVTRGAGFVNPGDKVSVVLN